MSRDGTGGDILSEKGGRYKRNVYAISLIATVLLITGAELAKVKLFGVGFPTDKAGNLLTGKESMAWTILLLIMALQWSQLIYYAWSDHRAWQKSVFANFLISANFICFGWQEGRPGPIYEKGGTWTCNGQDPTITDGSIIKTRYRLTRIDSGVADTAVDVWEADRQTVRGSLLMYWTIDFGLPAFWGLLVIVSMLYKALEWGWLNSIKLLFA